MDRLAGHVQNGAPEDDDPGKDNDMQHAARMARELMGSVRKIKLASLMYERTLICVSGMQGAGKTTLMKHFYGLDDDYLNISLERGEEIPVFITEKEDMTADKKPELYAIQIMKDENGEYHQQELEMSPEEFREASKGTNAATLYLELRVPHKHEGNEKTSFVLLPGFEARKSYRETLVDFAISSSDAAIFAFDGRLLSQQDNYRHLKELAEKFGAHIIYAITRSDSAVDGNAAVRETFMQEMKIENENQVVCTGAYAEPEMNEEWIRQLDNAIKRYGCTSMRSQENNIDYLKDEIDVIRGKLSEIEEILETRLWPHYGSREMGLGGAICCTAHEGMHMRENHCITEIIDENGNVLPDGEWGELVITTIGMEAQPLIRYRTGDWTRIIPGRCLCGSETKRLDFVKRMDPLGSIREMDELLFEIPELVDYCVKIVDGKKEITALFTSDNGEERIRSVLEEKDIRSWNCRKVKWEDLALYPGKRVTRQ